MDNCLGLFPKLTSSLKRRLTKLRGKTANFEGGEGGNPDPEMQTFLAYPDFQQSVECLEIFDLAHQRVAVWQILRTLNGDQNDWSDHPGVLMWDGYTEALVEYGLMVCERWTNMGRGDYIGWMIKRFSWGEEIIMPPWFGDEAYHAAQRSNLLRTKPKHYKRFGWTEPNNLPYVWPERVRHEDEEES